MGDGKRLKELIDRKYTTVRKVAKATGIKASTLYSTISSDSNIRVDNAIRIAKVLEVDITDICAASSDALTEDTLNNLDPIVSLMNLYGPSGLPDVDKFLTYYYMLDDKCRQEVMDFLQFKLQWNKVPKREEEIKVFIRENKISGDKL